MATHYRHGCNGYRDYGLKDGEPRCRDAPPCVSRPLRKVEAMVNWHTFVPTDVEYDFERDKLSEHGVTFEEALQCFFNDFEIRRNKRYIDRYQLLGRTDGGRRLKVIFQLKQRNVVRIITGWPI